MQSRTISIAIGALAIVAALAGLYYLGAQKPAEPKMAATVQYACNDQKVITASFYKGQDKPAEGGKPPLPGGSVALQLSDGRTVTLAQTVSADGVRYANADESFVFWTKGNGALVLEHNTEKSYIGCIAIAPEPEKILPQMFWNGSLGVTLRLPDGYGAASYVYTLAPKKEIHGFKFTIATTTSAGTNLASDTYVSIEGIPAVKNCTAALFLNQAKAATTTNAGTDYSVAVSTGAGAGNRYEETVYAYPGTNPCLAMRYFVHYGVIQNYSPGAVHEFDKQSLLSDFDAIRRSVRIAQ